MENETDELLRDGHASTFGTVDLSDQLGQLPADLLLVVGGALHDLRLEPLVDWTVRFIRTASIQHAANGLNTMISD